MFQLLLSLFLSVFVSVVLFTCVWMRAAFSLTGTTVSYYSSRESNRRLIIRLELGITCSGGMLIFSFCRSLSLRSLFFESALSVLSSLRSALCCFFCSGSCFPINSIVAVRGVRWEHHSNKAEKRPAGSLLSFLLIWDVLSLRQAKEQLLRMMWKHSRPF